MFSMVTFQAVTFRGVIYCSAVQLIAIHQSCQICNGVGVILSQIVMS